MSIKPPRESRTVPSEAPKPELPLTGDWLTELEAVISRDVGGRGIAADPALNLVTCTRGHVAAAARHLAGHAEAVAIVTGFFIGTNGAPTIETDGPPGALALADVLARRGVQCTIVTDPYGERAMRAAMQAIDAAARGVGICIFPFESDDPTDSERGSNEPAHSRRSLDAVDAFFCSHPRLTHLIAIERAGPSHTVSSQRVRDGADDDLFELVCPPPHQNHVHNFRGEVITPHTAKTHLLFELASRYRPGIRTIGIGDGGNEIGMGSIPWRVIQDNITSGNGGLVACRIATDWTITAGVSNWGGYALAAATAALGGSADLCRHLGPRFEQAVLQSLVSDGAAVDGVTKAHEMTVDGLLPAVSADMVARIERSIRVGTMRCNPA